MELPGGSSTQLLGQVNVAKYREPALFAYQHYCDGVVNVNDK